MSWIISIAAFIFILGVAINIHEFGHFIVAKLLKMRVEAFSFFGLGPRLWGFRIGHTDYRLSAIPLGAYVKLYGDEANDALEGKDQAAQEEVPAHELYQLRPRWQKFLVMIGGPAMNILLALAIPFAGALINGVEVEPTSPTVSRIEANGAAQEAGLQYGDKIVSFNDVENPTWKNISDDALLITNPPKALPLVIERNGHRISINITPKVLKLNGDEYGDLGFTPDYGQAVPVIFSVVVTDKAGAKAGIQPGDKLLTVNGEDVRNKAQATHLIRSSTSDTITLAVERKGQKIELKAVPDSEDENNGKVRKLNVNLEETPPRVPAGITKAGSHAVSENWRILSLTGRALKQLIAGERKASNTVSGPIGIAVAASQAASLGFGAVMTMLAFLSLNLGVFNLLPIPMLDGGQIFVLGIEGILAMFGKTLSQTVHLRIQQVGLVLILGLTVFAFANDIMKRINVWRGTDDKPPAVNTAPTPAPQK